MAAGQLADQAFAHANDVLKNAVGGISLASGMSAQDILTDYPQLTSEDIQASLAYAADRERHTAWVRAA